MSVVITTTTGYDQAGRVTTEATTGAGTVTRTYTDAGQLATVTDPLGHTVTFTYDQRGLLTGRTDQAGGTETWTHDPAGRVTSWTNQAAETTTYTYDPAGRPHTTTDPAGRTTTNSYDPAGRLAATVTADGATTIYSYDPAGRLDTVDGDGDTVTFTYTPDGTVDTVTETIDGAARQVDYDYDPAGRVIAVTDPTGVTTSYSLDGTGNITAMTDPAAGTATYTYDPAGRPDTVTLPGGHARDWTWHDGRLTGYTDGSDTWTLGYDTAGRLNGLTGAETATWVYDDASQLTAETRHGTTTQWAHTPTGAIDSVTRDGTVTDYRHDPANRVTAATTNGTTTAYDWDPSGRLRHVTGPDSAPVSYDYDPSGRLAATRTGDAVTRVIYVVKDPAQPTDGDRAVIDHLTGGGWDVAVVDDHDLTTPMAETADAVIVSKNSVPAVIAADLVGARVPVIVSDDRAHDDLGLAATDGTLVGDQTGIDITDPAHPAAAGHTGTVGVYTTGRQLVTATTPVASAHVVATAAGDPARAAVFTIDRGAPLADGTPAPARRVGLWPSNSAADVHTPAAWAIYDAALAWATDAPATLAYVTADPAAPSAGDTATISHLTTAGWAVDVIDDDTLTTPAAEAADAVIVSRDATTATVNTHLTPARVPVIASNSQLYDDLGLTTGTGTTTQNQTALTITSPAHPAAGGASGTTTIFGGSRNIVTIPTADVAANATIIATAAGQPDQAALVVLDTGQDGADGQPAPAPRAAWWATNTNTTAHTPGAWALLDATLTWATTTPAATTTRRYSPDGLLAATTTNGATTSLDWTRTAGIPQILAATTGPGTSRFLYGARRDLTVDPGGAVDPFAYDPVGNVTAGAAWTAPGPRDAYGHHPASPPGIGFGHKGELHTPDGIYLRHRTLHPHLGTFTAPDPLDGVTGRTTHTNRHHYADNNPTNRADPTGLYTVRDSDLTIEPGSDSPIWTLPSDMSPALISEIQTMSIFPKVLSDLDGSFGATMEFFNIHHKTVQLDIVARSNGSLLTEPFCNLRRYNSKAPDLRPDLCTTSILNPKPDIPVGFAEVKSSTFDRTRARAQVSNYAKRAKEGGALRDSAIFMLHSTSAEFGDSFPRGTWPQNGHIDLGPLASVDWWAEPEGLYLYRPKWLPPSLHAWREERDDAKAAQAQMFAVADSAVARVTTDVATPARPGGSSTLPAFTMDPANYGFTPGYFEGLAAVGTLAVIGGILIVTPGR